MKPRIVTFLAPKVGAGRTTAVMALASALSERRDSPVAVIDAIPQVRCAPGRPTSLTRWHQHIERHGAARDGLTVHHVSSIKELTDTIDGKVEQRLPSFSTILVDTGAQIDDLALTVVKRSDLLIVPFMDAITALRISEVLARVELGDTPLYGLKCGDACSEAEHCAVSAVFTAGRVLLHGLPLSPLLANMSTGGHLLSMYIKLTWDYSHYPLADPVRAPVRDFIKIKSEIGHLANEIRLALDGYELRRRAPYQRWEPLPVHKLAESLPT